MKKLKELFAVLYASSRSGVARIEFYENAKTSISGPFTLMLVGSDIMKVQKITGTSREDVHSFVVATKDQQYMFCSKNAHDCDQWVKAIQETIIQPIHVPTVVKKAPPNSVTIDNDIYASAEVAGSTGFEVTLAGETRKKLAVDGPASLTVEHGHITVIAKGGNRIARWGMQDLRRIGYSDVDFHVEAGRKTETGEGEFKFNTKKGKQIYNLVEREKTYCRSPGAKGRSSTLPAGMVAPTPVARHSPPLTIGGHIYEELDTLLQPERGGDARVVVKENHLSGPNPTKDPTLRGSFAMAGEAAAAAAASKSPQSPVQFPKSEYAGGAASTTPLMLGAISATKSPLTKNGLVQAYNETSTAGSNFANLPSNHVYTEVVHYKEAWKKFGVGDTENLDDDKEGAYDNLERFRISDIEVSEGHYETLPKAQPKPQNVAPIYAKIYKKKPEKH